MNSITQTNGVAISEVGISASLRGTRVVSERLFGNLVVLAGAGTDRPLPREYQIVLDSGLLVTPRTNEKSNDFENRICAPRQRTVEVDLDQ